jgi:hypothetical protein
MKKTVIAGSIGFVAIATGTWLAGCVQTTCEDLNTCGVTSDAGINDATTNNEASSLVDAADSAPPQLDGTVIPDASTDAFSEASGDALVDAGLDAADGFDGFVCDPTKAPHDEACVIADIYGVFVAPAQSGGSDTTGTGTQTKPYATVAHALANLSGKSRVYVCDATYTGAVTLSSATNVFGGLVCPIGGAADWTYSPGGRATLAAGATQPALTVLGVTEAVDIEDMGFMAPDASGQDDAGNGQSSLAVLVNNASNVTFRRCAFGAGAGANGIDGAMPSNYTGASAPSGQANDDAGNGGVGGIVTCNDETSSFGGQGGSEGPTSGTAGGDGGASPMPIANSALGLDGIGGAGGVARCVSGDPGANGASGDGGTAPSSYGTLSAQGWRPLPSSAGSNGAPGQGGGGGGGKSNPKQGGTGGGAGGCGGAGGTAGGAGGASIALACVSSTVTLDTCTMQTGAGGQGGNGGPGQPGQAGGAGGLVAGPCTGGYGGNGAGGAGGAGGNGGVSLCVLLVNSNVSGTPGCIPAIAGTAGTAGAGGAGGDNGQGNPSAAGGNGAAGNVGISQSSLTLP